MLGQDTPAERIDLALKDHRTQARPLEAQLQTADTRKKTPDTHSPPQLRHSSHAQAPTVAMVMKMKMAVAALIGVLPR